MKFWARIIDAHGESLCKPRRVTTNPHYDAADSVNWRFDRTRFEVVATGVVAAIMFVDIETGQPLPKSQQPRGRFAIGQHVRSPGWLAVNSSGLMIPREPAEPDRIQAVDDMWKTMRLIYDPPRADNAFDALIELEPTVTALRSELMQIGSVSQAAFRAVPASRSVTAREIGLAPLIIEDFELEDEIPPPAPYGE